jgi:chromosome segregation ATPase
MSGWKLTAALITKHVGVVGDRLATAIASFDPETATEVDRDNLKEKLREVALKLADAKHKNDAAQQALRDLEALIASDSKTAEVLIAKHGDGSGKVDDAMLNEFAAALEANQAKLAGVKQDAANAQELVDTLKEILDTVEKNLNEFDAKAKAAIGALQQAQADQQRAELHQQQQAELNALRSGTGGTSTGLSALNRAADKARVQADAAQTIADIGQKPIDRANVVEEARRIAAGTDTSQESAIDRLRRAAGK